MNKPKKFIFLLFVFSVLGLPLIHPEASKAATECQQQCARADSCQNHSREKCIDIYETKYCKSCWWNPNTGKEECTWYACGTKKTTECDTIRWCTISSSTSCCAACFSTLRVTQYGCVGGTCRSSQQTIDCSAGISCTDDCPCTASAKSSPWIEGTAPTGYIAACKSTTSCQCDRNDCSKSTFTRNWYLPNLPTSVAQSQEIQYCLNGSCTSLSTNQSVPTAVEINSTLDAARLRVINPAISEGRGTRNDWKLDYLNDGTSGCTGDDHCQTDDADDYTDNFGTQFYNTGGAYSISYTNGVLKSCTNESIKASTPLVAYFVFNNVPEVVTTDIDEQMGTEPDDDNGRVCTTDNNPVEFTVTYRDKDGASEITRLGFWIDEIYPAAGEVSDSVHGAFDINGGTYSALGYDCSSGTCQWSVTGSAIPGTVRNLCSDAIGNSDKSESSGGCLDRIGSWTITGIQYESNGTDITVDYKVWIDKDLGSNLDIYGYGEDSEGGVSLWEDAGDILLDLEPPEFTLPSSYRVVDNTKIEIDWSVDDTLTNVTEIYGYAFLQSSGQVDGPIKDITSNVDDYDIRDGAFEHGSIKNNANKDLWALTDGTISRTERIDLLQNEGNEIGFGAETVDGVCNMGDESAGQQSQSLDDAWVTTKGGAVFSDDGVGFTTNRAIEDDGHYLTREDALWLQPYRFKIDDVDNGDNDIAISTEFFSVTSGSFEFPSNINNPAVGFGLNNYLNTQNDLYSDFDASVAANINGGISILPLLTPNINTSTIQRSSDLDGCNGDQCVFSYTGNMSITTSTNTPPTPFVCDKPTVFIIRGDISLEPDILKGTQPDDGCMFIAQGHITIKTGMTQTENPSCNSGTLTNSSICYPPYDRLDGMLISDGQIIIEEDFNTLLYEGLLVHGSLIATGGGSGPSISSARSLKLINNPKFPSVVVHFDPVYLKTGRSVFHFTQPAYVSDVGYKP